jgi:thiamine kinase-like enzyme
LARGGTVPPIYDELRGYADRIAAVMAGALVPCHNDLLTANFLDDGEGLRILDWEYAGMGDRFFDLANFAVNHELDADGESALLTSYFGEARPADAKHLRLLRFMSDFREAMWGVLQQGVSDLDFDFAEYAARHFERLRRTAASEPFRAALTGAHPRPPTHPRGTHQR